MLTCPFFWGMAKDAEIARKLNPKGTRFILIPDRRKEYRCLC